MALMIKTFNRAFRKFNKKIGSNSGYNRESQFARKTEGSSSKFKKMQCHECQGFGHVQSECANTLKKQNKSYNTTLSNEETDNSSDEDEMEKINCFIVFNVVAESTDNQVDDDPLHVESESEDEEFTDEAIKEPMQNLQNRLEAVINVNQKLLERIEELTVERDLMSTQNSELKQIISKNKGIASDTTGDFQHMKKFVRRMNNGSLQLDEILNKGKVHGDLSGFGYNGSTKPSKVIGIDDGGNSQDYKEVPPHYKESESAKLKKRFTPICHYCEKK